MNKQGFFRLAFLIFSIWGFASDGNLQELTKIPPYLYKVLTVEEWKLSQQEGKLLGNSPEIKEFYIEEQLETVLITSWLDAESLVVLKIDSQKLPSDCRLERRDGLDLYLCDTEVTIDAVLKAETF